jgi:hypothetical protein
MAPIGPCYSINLKYEVFGLPFLLRVGADPAVDHDASALDHLAAQLAAAESLALQDFFQCHIRYMKSVEIEQIASQ